MTATFQHWGMSYDWAWFLATVIGILVIALPLMLAVAMIIYADRKIWAAMALRRGPNVVGPWGLLQSFADGLKVFLKETILSLIHISEPTRQAEISYAVFCLKKKST